MPKPKVNKLARMSDEERAKYLQHRADIEEEARRRKQELISRFIKNKLDKEEAYSRLNTMKLNQQWRFVLRRIKSKQMAQDIQKMMTSFNFLLERKDRLVVTLQKCAEDADEQHRRAFQAHTENISFFLSIGSQRLDKLQAEYERRRNMLLEYGEKDEIALIVNQERAEYKLKLITYIQNRDFQKNKKEKAMEFASAKNDARLELEEELRNLWMPKQLEIETYWNKLREVYTTYLEQHKPIMNHYNSLREKDDFYQKEIARNEMFIQISTETLQNLQHEWHRTTTTTAEKLSRMTKRNEELSRNYMALKKASKIEKGKEDQLLGIMVNASQDAIKRLEEVKGVLDKIRQMSEICVKYEHEGDNKLIARAEDTDLMDFNNLDGDGAMIEECKEFNKMEKFLLKVNRTKVQTLCLKTEKAKLIKENIQIKNYIKKYLTELALRGKDRPLSMKIRSEVQKIDSKIPNRPVTCIEGALSNAVQHEKRLKILEIRSKESAIKAYPRVQCWM